MHAKGLISLAVTVLLCLPSLVGGSALLFNQWQYGNIEQWEQTSSALVALGVLFGGPLVAVAALVGGTTAIRSNVRVEFKFVQLVTVGLAAIAAFTLLLRFGR
ncbi:MAG TPA: hypothetical protein VEG30_10890 [Terriglobales bacterium]|nr:hypothetical protein [Terriglobales bacterium]